MLHPKHRRLLLALFTILTTGSAAVAGPASTPKTVALVHATVEVGDGTVVEDGTVVFSGPSIVSVTAKGAPPAGAVVVDVTGKVVSPGFIAASSQVGLFEIGLESAAVDHSQKGDLHPAFRPALGFNPLSNHIPVEREEGVTSAVLAPSGGPMIAGRSDLVEFHADVDGDLTRDVITDKTTPVAMHGRFNGDVADRFGGARAGALATLQQLIDDARFLQKNRAAYDKGQSRPLIADQAELLAMQPVLQGKIPLIVDVDRASDILALLELARREKLKLIVESGKEAWLVADQLKAQKVPVIVLPSYAGTLSFNALHARDDLATVLHQAGVTVLLTSWESENGTTRLRQEAGIAIQRGLPRDVAIRAIAQGPAEVLGLTHNKQALGVLKKGARANVVVWSGDPLETSSVVERLWVAGLPVTTPSRSRLLADRYLKAIRQEQAAQPAKTQAPAGASNR